jgi:hypothetical protein
MNAPAYIMRGPGSWRFEQRTVAKARPVEPAKSKDATGAAGRERAQLPYYDDLELL